MSARDRFRLLAAQPASGTSLGAVVLAAGIYVATGTDDPALELATTDRFDALAAGCPTPTAEGVMAHLFRDEGFEGNALAYDDPRNSYLHDVVERRLGIPISLAVLAIAVGARIGVSIVGIGMPGHFLVRDGDDVERFFDPFDRGRALDQAGCAQRFHQVHGPGAPFGLDHLEPSPPVAIVARVLNNLRAVHARAHHRAELRRVLELGIDLTGGTDRDREALAAALASEGRFAAAASELEGLAQRREQAGAAEDAARYRNAAIAQRSRDN